MLVVSEHDGVTVIKTGTHMGGEVPYWTYCYRYGTLLFDAGCPNAGAEIQEYAAHHAPIEAVLITHFHEDHVGGAAALQEMMEVFAPAASLDLLANPPDIPAYRKIVWGQPLPVRAEPLETRRCWGDREVETIVTPGHSFDHVSYLVDGRLFAGDLVISPGQVVCMREEKLQDTMASLARILERDFQWVFSGVGVVDRGHVGAYLDYLKEIAEKVKKLRDQGLGLSEMAAVIFPNPPPKVLLMESISGKEWSRENFLRSLLAG